MISASSIDQVFETARVEEVIGDFVQLKKAGSNFKGLSPFSDERSPSFMVSPVKQIWKDFSSGKGGNVVAFLMEHEHFTYPEAIKYLAKKYNIEIEETVQSDEQKQAANERESLYLVSEFASKYFQNILHKTDQGKSIGLSYFKERGFTENTIKTFDLGYSLDEWQAFTDEALKQGYNIDYLEKAGLTIVKETKRFDRFKGRVMFPIKSMSGRVLGFGGRILINDKKAAKYVNSPESDIYHKSKVLYGIYHAKQSIAKEDNCYLVEGYTDVIQFHQTGIKNVVSSSGTALTSEQIRLINRLKVDASVQYLSCHVQCQLLIFLEFQVCSKYSLLVEAKCYFSQVLFRFEDYPSIPYWWKLSVLCSRRLPEKNGHLFQNRQLWLLEKVQVCLSKQEDVENLYIHILEPVL